MARKNPIPDRERQICQRVRLIRKEKRLSQVAFAEMLGIDSSLLASYEHSRVPIRYEFADRLCCIFKVCQRWLADGDLPTKFYVHIENSVADQIPARMLFSEAYDHFLKPQIEKYFSQVGEWLREATTQAEVDEVNEAFPASVKAVDPDDFLLYVIRLIRPVSAQLPPHLYGELYRRIAQQLRAFRAEHRALVAKHSEITNKSEKHGLTGIHVSANMPNVKAQWPLLKKRLQKATSIPGGKTRLAEFLGLKLVSVSQWLTDSKNAREPGAETALRMLSWVEQQERK